MIRHLPLVALLFLTGCGPIEGKVRSSLINAGIGPEPAACMAKQMVDKLSLLQLRRMASLGNFQDESVKGMTKDRFFHNVRALKDPQILTVTSAAWLKCTI
jgi:predicted ThiF/HesA family dinucleotide-utilizing enzyme